MHRARLYVVYPYSHVSDISAVSCRAHLYVFYCVRTGLVYMLCIRIHMRWMMQGVFICV